MDLYCAFEISCDLPTFTGAGTGTFYSGNASGAGTGGTTQVLDTAAAGSPAAVGPVGAIGGPLLHDLGRGRKRLLLNVQMVTTYLATGGASTLTANLVADDDANGTNRQIVMPGAAYAKATLVQGFRWPFGSLPGRVYNSAGSPGRYVYMQYVVATNACTTGKISAWLSLDIDDHAEIFGTI